MSEAPQKVESQELQTHETQQAIALTIQKLDGIRDFVASALKEGPDYDKIPGTPKRSLLQPGAEKVALYLNARPEYIITKTELGDGHVEYEVTCTLHDKHTGLPLGQGVGTLSTMDSNHRYRWHEEEKPSDAEQVALKRQGLGKWVKRKRKGAEVWVWLARSDTPNIWDERHTVLQMARKRAYVQATRTFAALSEYFTQDGEDAVRSNGDPGNGNKAAAKPPIQEPKRKSESQSGLVTGMVKRINHPKGKNFCVVEMENLETGLFLFDNYELPLRSGGTIKAFDLLKENAKGRKCSFQVESNDKDGKSFIHIKKILKVSSLEWGEDGLPVYQTNLDDDDIPF